MNWRLIPKNRHQPQGDDPASWKQQVADDCFKQCVFCSIGEGPWGGLANYHVEHYRPVSRFPSLRTVITNLFLACPICNRFKSDIWPAEPTSLEIVCFPDPSETDYCTLFRVSPNYYLVGNNVAANYVIGQLYLNRPQLLYERRETTLMEKEKALTLQITQLIRGSHDIARRDKFDELRAKISVHLHERKKISPYKLSEIRKSGT